MQRAKYFSDQLVLSTDLDEGTDAMISQSVLRAQAQLITSGGYGIDTTYARTAAGIFGSPRDYLTAANFSGSVLSLSQLSIQAGKALTVAGEFINAPQAFTINAGDNEAPISYGGVQIGKVSFVLVTANPTIRYVKLAYTEFPRVSKTDDSGTAHYTRYDAGWSVTIDKTAPTTDEILLYTFTADVDGHIATAITDRRLYVRVTTTADAVVMNPLTKPVATHFTMDDHIRAVGTGVPTNTNPHALTLEDIGGNNVGEDHMKTAHVSGIMLQRYQAGYAQSFSASVVNGVIDYLSFYSPTYAAAAVNGNFFSASVPNLSVSAAPASGDYWAVIDAAGTPQWISSSVISADYFNLNPRSYPQYTPIAYATLDTGSGDITAITDKRQFFTTLQQDIRVDNTEAYTFDGLDTRSSLVFFLNRIRFALGRALTGSSSSWDGSVHPLTSGLTLHDNTYHQHDGLTTYAFTLGLDQGAGTGGAFRVERTGPAYASLTYDGGTSVWRAYSTQNSVFADVAVKRLAVQNNGLIDYVGTAYGLYRSDGTTLADVGVGTLSINNADYLEASGATVSIKQLSGTLASASVARLKVNNTGFISAESNAFSMYQSDGTTFADVAVKRLAVQNNGLLDYTGTVFTLYQSNGVSLADVSAKTLQINSLAYIEAVGETVAIRLGGGALASASVASLLFAGTASPTRNIAAGPAPFSTTITTLGVIGGIFADIGISSSIYFAGGLSTHTATNAGRLFYDDATQTFQLFYNAITEAPLSAASFQVGNTKVVGGQITGWAAPPNPDRTQTWTTATISDAEVQKVAKSLSALIADLKTHGLISA